MTDKFSGTPSSMFWRAKIARRMARAARRWVVSNTGGPRRRASTSGGAHGMPRGDAAPSSPRT
eukprot:10559792-Alexandrium_andersonii.AAC.1